MKKLLTFATALLALTLAGSATAAQITGGITFTGGGATYDTLDVATATRVVSWNGVSVGSRSGDFVGFINAGDSVTLAAPWTFNSGALAALWTVGGFTFDLVSSSIFSQSSAGLIVTGTGWLSGNGYAATWGTWNFSTQNPDVDGVFSFSASGGFKASPPPQVPDGGTTAALLGAALLGAAFVARRRTA
jgi:hypothetical protein